ncbi:MAG TPA: hypothetical protein VHP30_09430 [Ignavibacteriales bacterium]|nr:hypothetical protein [Ignavibacteriales bacterium]
MKKLIPIILFALVLVAGCDNSSENAGEAAHDLTLDGQIVNWQAGNSYYISYTIKDPSDRGDDPPIAASKSSISGDGSFSLKIIFAPDSIYLKNIDPFILSDSYQLRENINSDSVIITPSDAKVAEAFLYAARNGEKAYNLGGMRNVNNGDTLQVRFIYSDRTVSIHGKGIIEAERGRPEYNFYYAINLEKGWNRVGTRQEADYKYYITNIDKGKCLAIPYSSWGKR